MGEMLVANMKDNLPLIIIRPIIVISTHSETFPGWIENTRDIDYVIDKYGKGLMRSFVGLPETVLDVIPADMVVNSMIIASVARSKNLCRSLIYHIGSSSRNPFKFSDLVDGMHCYFSKNPWINKNDTLVHVGKKLTLFSTTMDDFDKNKVFVCKRSGHKDGDCDRALQTIWSL
ncbi:putative alcohol-forming fatty acyl-CoA reductase [Medicago truncatula]|uniref:Fatty acyl-CoA reductase n=1 Tax=Medicago truncatula TaxID=3880 RepID=A0A396HCV4_MEDTR|nr:putative alcohol-forming fatty acyl-CoA reductase [Medicago truncatula]